MSDGSNEQPDTGDGDAPARPSVEPAGPTGWGPPPTTAAPAAPKRRAGRIALAVIGVLGIGAGTAFAVTQLTGGEKSNTPEEAVESFYRAVETGDFIGLAKTLAPGERDVMLDSLVPLVNELSRLEILEKEFDLEKVKGYTAKLSDYKATATLLRPDLAAVRVTGGNLNATFDPKNLPFGDFLRDQFGKQIDEAEATTSSSSLSFGSDDSPIVVQKVGNRWYLSVNYSIAEAARNESKTPFAVPARGRGVPARGARTPEAAVAEMMQAGARLDLRRVIELLPPDEFAALHDYSGEFIPDAERQVADFRKQYSLRLRPKLRTTKLADDRSLVQITDVPLEFTSTINEQRISVSYANREGSASFTSADGEDLRAEYKDNCLNLVLDGEKKRGCGRDGLAKLFTDLTGTPIDFTSLPATTGGINGPCTAKRKAVVGFTVIKRDGLWYVSPTRTMFDAMTATMKTLDRANLDCLVKETKKVIDSSGRSLTGSDVAAQAATTPQFGSEPPSSDPSTSADDAVQAEDPVVIGADTYNEMFTADSMGNATLLADTPACREFKAKSDAGESPSAEVIDQCFSDAFDTEP